LVVVVLLLLLLLLVVVGHLRGEATLVEARLGRHEVGQSGAVSQTTRDGTRSPRHGRIQIQSGSVGQRCQGAGGTSEAMKGQR
jgi:hypothetical protein